MLSLYEKMYNDLSRMNITEGRLSVLERAVEKITAQITDFDINSELKGEITTDIVDLLRLAVSYKEDSYYSKHGVSEIGNAVFYIILLQQSSYSCHQFCPTEYL